MNYVDLALHRLYEYYDVANSKELSKKINVSQSTISSWKTRNSINAIKRKCIELGIYDEIIGYVKWFFDSLEEEKQSRKEHSTLTFNHFLEKMLVYFNASSIKELSAKIGIPPDTISKWKQRQSISALKKVTEALGVYNEIFEYYNPWDITPDINKFEKIENIKKQCVAYDIQTTTLKNRRLLYLLEHIALEAETKSLSKELEKDLISLFFKYNPLLDINSYPIENILDSLDNKLYK